MNPPPEIPLEAFEIFLQRLLSVWRNLCNERFREEFFQAIHHPSLGLSVQDLEGIGYQAARFGHCKVLEWCNEHGFPWDTFECLKIAMTNGHVNILKWFRRQGCPWNGDRSFVAAASGNLRILQWCRNEGCPWDERTCNAAAMNGHLIVLKWCRENGCPCDKDTHCFTADDEDDTEDEDEYYSDDEGESNN